MNRKQLIALLIVLMVLGGAGIIVYKHNSSSWKAAPATGKVLGDFALNDVAKLVIQTGSSTLTLSKKNDTWVVPERDDYPADFARIGDLIQTLWQLKPKEDVQAGLSQLGRLELLPPKGIVTGSYSGTLADGGTLNMAMLKPPVTAAPEGTGVLIELQNKDSKRIAALLIGKKLLKKSPQFPDQEGFPVGRYVMPADSTPPRISLVAETLEQADPTPAAWLDKAFLHIDRIQSVTLASDTNQWTLSRDSDAATEWKLAGIKPGETVDQTKVPQFAQLIGSPAFNDVMPVATKPAGFDSTVTVTTFDQFTYTFKFGKPDGDNLSMSVAVTANPPKERTPGKTETPEEKKKLDDEFAANAKRLANALARDKTYELRIYLVQKAMFDPLFASRSDLLAAPAPSSTPGPAPAGLPVTTPLPPAPASPVPSASPSPAGSPEKSASHG